MRSANGSVVQFLYGEDGMDGTAIEGQKLDSLRMHPGKFRVRARTPHTWHYEFGSTRCTCCLADAHSYKGAIPLHARYLNAMPAQACRQT